VGRIVGGWRTTALTLALGGAGGALASAVGLPAPWLVGSAAAVAAAAFTRLHVNLADALRDASFAMIGIAVGASVSPETVRLATRWPFSLLALAACLALTTAASSVYLARVRGWEAETAFLSATPGGLSLALALAAQGYGDLRAVSLSQCIRLMTLTIGLPLAIGGGGAVLRPLPGATMPLHLVGLLLALSLAAAVVLARAGVPAPLLIAGMVVSAVPHLLGVIPGNVPEAAAIPVFVVVGCTIGVRFRGVTPAELRRGVGAGLVMVAIASAISAAFAAGVARALHMPFAQAWVAFAPGGVESMTAMAIALGIDQAYVGVHHLVRILLLSALLPLVLMRIVSRRGGEAP
jgi:uncharacterized protein